MNIKDDITSMFRRASFVAKLYVALFAILLVYVIVFVGSEIRNSVKEHKYIGVAPQFTNIVSFDGTGEVVATPNVATVSLGVTTDAKDVAKAQQDNSTKMNALQDAIKALGVEAKDIQTKEFSVFPRYSYNPENGKQSVDGYSMTHSVEVKIRNLDLVDDVLKLGVDKGVNQISGVSFTIEDKDALIAQARQEAMKKAKQKMMDISKTLRLRPVRLVNYSEYVPEEGVFPMPYYGGDMMSMTKSAIAPEVSAGSQKVKVVVTLSYEVR